MSGTPPICFCVGLVLIASALSAAELRVRSGDDLIAAINAANEGDGLSVSEGSYAGGVITRSRVTVKGGQEGAARIAGGVVLEADGVVLENLVWEDQNGQLVQICGQRNIVRKCVFRRFGKMAPSKAIWIRETGDHRDTLIEDCLFEDWGGATYHSSCIKVSQTGYGAAFTGTVIRGNTLRRGAVGGNSPAIQLFCPTLVENNTIHDCEDGVETKGGRNVIRHNVVFRCLGGEAMSNRSGSDNLFEGNTLYDIPAYAWQIWSGQRNVWRNNVVYNCGRIAHIKGGLRPESKAADVLLINNTFVNNRRGVSWDLKKFPPARVRFINNIFVGDGASTIEEAGAGLYTGDYNLFFKFRIPGAPGAHSIVGKDPLFVAPEIYDFHLRAESPARQAGLPVPQGAPDHDKDGTPRPQEQNVDMGAYQHLSATQGDR